MENCTRYDCMETTVGAVILASGVVCPPFNDTECVQVRSSNYTTLDNIYIFKVKPFIVYTHVPIDNSKSFYRQK